MIRASRVVAAVSAVCVGLLIAGCSSVTQGRRGVHSLRSVPRAAACRRGRPQRRAGRTPPTDRRRRGLGRRGRRQAGAVGRQRHRGFLGAELRRRTARDSFTAIEQPAVLRLGRSVESGGLRHRDLSGTQCLLLPEQADHGVGPGCVRPDGSAVLRRRRHRRPDGPRIRARRAAHGRHRRRLHVRHRERAAGRLLRGYLCALGRRRAVPALSFEHRRRAYSRAGRRDHAARPDPGPQETEMLEEGHGTALDRVSAFQMGFVGGASECAAIDLAEIEERRGDLPMVLPLDQGGDVQAARCPSTRHPRHPDGSLGEVYQPGAAPRRLRHALRRTRSPARRRRTARRNTISVDLPARQQLGEVADEIHYVLLQGDNSALSVVTSLRPCHGHENGDPLDTPVAALRMACLTGVAQRAMAETVRCQRQESDAHGGRPGPGGFRVVDERTGRKQCGREDGAWARPIVAYRSGLGGDRDLCHDALQAAVTAARCAAAPSPHGRGRCEFRSVVVDVPLGQRLTVRRGRPALEPGRVRAEAIVHALAECEVAVRAQQPPGGRQGSRVAEAGTGVRLTV